MTEKCPYSTVIGWTMEEVDQYNEIENGIIKKFENTGLAAIWGVLSPFLLNTSSPSLSLPLHWLFYVLSSHMFCYNL